MLKEHCPFVCVYVYMYVCFCYECPLLVLARLVLIDDLCVIGASAIADVCMAGMGEC